MTLSEILHEELPPNTVGGGMIVGSGTPINHGAPLYLAAPEVKQAPLFIHGKVAISRTATLYTYGIFSHKGPNLFLKVNEPNLLNDNTPLFTFCTTNSGRFRSAPLFLKCEPGAGNVGKKPMNLYLLGASKAAVVRNMNLFCKGSSTFQSRTATLFAACDDVDGNCFVLDSDGNSELLIEDNSACLQVEPDGDECFVMENDITNEIIAESLAGCLSSEDLVAKFAPLFIRGDTASGGTPFNENLSLFIRRWPGAMQPLFLRGPGDPASQAALLFVRGATPITNNFPLVLPKTSGKPSNTIRLVIRGF